MLSYGKSSKNKCTVISVCILLNHTLTNEWKKIKTILQLKYWTMKETCIVYLWYRFFLFTLS
jgi:hypothetical protein